MAILLLALAVLPLYGADASSTTTTLVAVQTSNRPGVIQLTATVRAHTDIGSVSAGQVQFRDGKLVLGTVQGVAQADGSLIATLATRSFVPGTHTLTAKFMGAPYAAVPTAPSIAAPIEVAVAAPVNTGPTINLSFGSGILTADVSSTTPLSGTVAFMDQTAGVSLGAVTLPSSEGLPQPLDFPQTNWFATGQGPIAMVVADLNNDGVPDVAVANQFDGTISVLLGDPEHPGQLLAQTAYAVGQSPTSIVAADFNADGLVDLAVANGDGTISLLFGDRAHPGQFLTQTQISTGFSAANLAAADFNGDGLPDLVYQGASGTSSAGHLYVLLNIPSAPGTFGPSPIVSAFSTLTQQGAAGDFNGDGLTDYVSGGVIYWNDPTNPGFFSVSSPLDNACTYCSASQVVAADLNGDGIPDIVVAGRTSPPNSQAPTVFIETYLSSASAPGGFTQAGVINFNADSSGCPFNPSPTWLFPFVPTALAIGDFNGDGVPDLAASGYQHSQTDLCPSPTYTAAMLVAPGTASAPGTFQTPTYPITYALAGANYAVAPLVVADFNGDGLADIAYGNPWGYPYPTGVDVALASNLYTATATLTGIDVFGTGTQNIVATLSGVAGGSSVSSASLAVTGAGPANTSVLLIPPSDVVEAGASVTLSVVVSAIAFGPPNGTVTWSDGSTLLGTATLDADGRATIATSFTPGSHRVSATYAGSDFFASSTSATISIEAFGSSNPNILSASPNPVVGSAPSTGAGLGITTLTWNAPSGVTNTELHIATPTGPLFSSGGPSGSATTGEWATDGMTFYLQDTSGGKSLTAANTLATLTVHLSLGSYLTAIPDPIFQAQDLGSASLGVTTLYWSSPSAVAKTEIHIGAPDGVLFTGGGPSGKATTGLWAAEGMTFYLQDTTNGKPLTGANTLGTATIHLSQPVLFSASPDPITASSMAGPAPSGSTTLTWNAPDAAAVAVYAGQPAGAPVYSGGSSGTTPAIAATDGEVFFLVDVSNGSGAVPAIVLAQVVIHLQQPVEFTLTLNPIPVLSGEPGVTTVLWNAPGASSTAVLVGPPPRGPIMTEGGGPTGTEVTGPWVTDGMRFYLQDTSGGRPLTLNNTLATVTAHLENLPEFAAFPNPIRDVTAGGGAELGLTTLQWNAPSVVTSTEIHIGAPDAVMFTGGGRTGSAATGLWVTDGMTFYLQDTTGGKLLTAANTLATVVVHLQHQVQFTADPNPITNPVIAGGVPFGVTTLNWNITGVERVEIHILTPDGILFANAGPSGSATTGQWVTDGMTFYLQDVTGGMPLTATNTLASISIRIPQ